MKPDPKKNISLGTVEILPNEETIETHTVVLYKNLAGKILVIDPSNPKFIGHLKHADPGRIELLNSQNLKYNLYTPKGNTGPTGELWRDCVDIAVKLAALLDNDPTEYNSFDGDIGVMSSPAVRLVSNNSAITKLEAPEDKPLRVKQVSNLEQLKAINYAIEEHDRSFKKQVKEAIDKLKAAKELLELGHEIRLEKIKAAYEESIIELAGKVACDLDSEGGSGV